MSPTPFGEGGLLGGGERYPIELSRALAPHVDCQLLTFGRFAREWREPGGLTVRVLPRLAHALGHPAHPLSFAIPAALRTAGIVHTHHMRSLPSMISALSARTLRKHLVVTDHGLMGSDLAGLLPAAFERFLTVSEWSARELGAPRLRTRVIYGGADPVRYYPGPTTRRDGALFVGRITPHKGVDRLIAALPQGPVLRIAGSTGHDSSLPERDYPTLLQRMAVGKGVRFLGPVSDADLPGLYRSARVFVLPSVEKTCYGRDVRVSELLGLTVLEAMASGTPVICSRMGGLPEIVQHGVTGLLVDPGDTAQLHEALESLLCNPLRAERMGRAARELLLERFTWEKCAERCLRAYEELRP